MKIRAIWIVSNDGNGWSIIFFRRFSNVENHVKRMQQQLYVAVPDNSVILKQLVEKLWLEPSFMKYVEGRDCCENECLSPVYSLPISSNSEFSLPVVILPKKNVIFFCAPFIEGSETNQPMANNPIIAVSLNLLMSMAECLNPLPEILTRDYSKLPILDDFLSQCIPLGRPLDTSFQVTSDKLQNNPSTIIIEGAKQPAWKPVLYKGKGQVSLTMTEYVRSHQYDRTEKSDVTAVYGSILCSAKLEGATPELILTVANENPKNKLAICDLSVHPCVSFVEPVEHKNGEANLPHCNLRCMPPLHDFTLCNYVVPVESIRPPVLGALKLRGFSKGDLLLQLKLDETLKNSFEYFTVTIPFLEREPISIADLKPTWGMANVTSDLHGIFWNLGTKFPSKTLQVSLSATIVFGDVKQLDKDADDPSKILNYAKLQFCVKSFVLSSSHVDSKSIYTAPPSKFKLSSEKELLTSDYKIWNSCSDAITPTPQWI